MAEKINQMLKQVKEYLSKQKYFDVISIYQAVGLKKINKTPYEKDDCVLYYDIDSLDNIIKAPELINRLNMGIHTDTSGGTEEIGRLQFDLIKKEFFFGLHGLFTEENEEMYTEKEIKEIKNSVKKIVEEQGFKYKGKASEYF